MGRSIDFDIIVVGGGIVGLATAYKIGRHHPGVSIAVLEKEPHLALHQTGHNSGVIHSGLYYKPNSAKAKTCAEGRKELIAFAREHNIAYEICGKVIVAADEKELANLERIFRNGVENGIEGIEKIGPAEIKRIEPFCDGIAGVKVPCTGIIDFMAVAEKLGRLLKEKGSNEILLSHKVVGFEKDDNSTRVYTSQGTLSAKYIINCAGLHSDRIATLSGVRPDVRIVPFRGDYYELMDSAKSKVRNLIYPVPDPAFPFLGVHFTRTIDGLVECGPNAVFSFKREGYGKFDFNLGDSWDSLTYPGTLKMFAKNWRYGLAEYRRAFCKNRFLRQLQRLIPSLQPDDIKPGTAGVRAQAVGPDGEAIDDFRIEPHGNAVHVLNAPSPAATASLAIGDFISRMAATYFNL